jgi:hypothetical protein
MTTWTKSTKLEPIIGNNVADSGDGSIGFLQNYFLGGQFKARESQDLNKMHVLLQNPSSVDSTTKVKGFVYSTAGAKLSSSDETATQTLTAVSNTLVALTFSSPLTLAAGTEYILVVILEKDLAVNLRGNDFRGIGVTANGGAGAYASPPANLTFSERTNKENPVIIGMNSTSTPVYYVQQ